MLPNCPVNTVDERAARTCAGMVVIIAALSIWPPAMPLIFVLAVDFAIRGFSVRRYSPLRLLAKTITGLMGVQPKPVYAPPKRFAAQVGCVITVVASLLHLLGLHAAAVAMTGILIVAASLEVGLGFCLACWLYPFVLRIRQTR